MIERLYVLNDPAGTRAANTYFRDFKATPGLAVTTQEAIARTALI